MHDLLGWSLYLVICRIGFIALVINNIRSEIQVDTSSRGGGSCGLEPSVLRESIRIILRNVVVRRIQQSGVRSLSDRRRLRRHRKIWCRHCGGNILNLGALGDHRRQQSRSDGHRRLASSTSQRPADRPEARRGHRAENIKSQFSVIARCFHCIPSLVGLPSSLIIRHARQEGEGLCRLLVTILNSFKLFVGIVRIAGDIDLRCLMGPLANTGAQSSNGILIIGHPVTQVNEVSATDSVRYFIFSHKIIITIITF